VQLRCGVGVGPAPAVQAHDQILPEDPQRLTDAECIQLLFRVVGEVRHNLSRLPYSSENQNQDEED
jgi:hypothetical protein